MVLVATQVKRRRGTTAENDAFTGAEGEITVDTEKHELRVHDGVTRGGFKIPTAESLDFASKSLDNLSSNGEARFTAKVDKGHELIDFQIPTAGNGYTWYRKYADGWVEQGGFVFPTTSTVTRVSVTLPITMGNNVYSVQVTCGDNIAEAGVFSYYTNRTTTGFEILYSHTTSSYTIGDSWQVSGMSAQ